MIGKFNDVPPRKPIDRAGLVSIYERQFGASAHGILVPELIEQIKRFGRCECTAKCKTPLAGVCEWDHKYIHAASKEADKIHWQPVTPSHHKQKTKGDTKHAAKLKRVAVKYNPEYQDEAPVKPESKWQSGGFKKHPTMKRTVSGKVVPR